MMSFTDDGLHWNKNNLHFNELGLPYTVPPWDQTFPQNSFKQYTWQEIYKMSGLELLQHFTVRFSPVILRSRSSLRQVTYRCNLVSACRREFSGFIGVQKMIRHIKRHLAKLEEHRMLNNYCKHYIENLTFYAVGDKFPTGITGSNDEMPPHVEAKRERKSKRFDNGKHKTTIEKAMGTHNAMKTATAKHMSPFAVRPKFCNRENNTPVISDEESIKQDGVPVKTPDINFEQTKTELFSSSGAEEAIHQSTSVFQVFTSPLPTTSAESLSSSFECKSQHEQDHGIEKGTLTPKRNTNTTSAGFLTGLTTMTDVSKTSLEGISDLCKKLKDEEAQLTANEQENIDLNENSGNDFPPCMADLKLSSCLQNGAGGSQKETKNYSLGKTDSSSDTRKCSSNGNLTKIATKFIDVPSQDTQENFNEINFKCEGRNSPPRMLISDAMEADVPFTAKTCSEVLSSSTSSSNLPSQNLQVSQSKYGELLAVIEEIGKDIRPTYAGSKNASERLKKGIMHARALVRECLIETERCARQ